LLSGVAYLSNQSCLHFGQDVSDHALLGIADFENTASELVPEEGDRLQTAEPPTHMLGNEHDLRMGESVGE
jgi:hypothetical protein